MTTREKILQETEIFILKNGIEKLTISKIAKKLNISQPAIYKHFKNKEELLTVLALRFLNEQTLSAIFPFDTTNYTQKVDIIHDWLWAVASAKFYAHQETPEMFALYTTYVSENQALSQEHILEMVQSLQSAAALSKPEQAGALIQAFAYFHHPKVAPQWDNSFQEQFENVWLLIKKNFE